MKNYRKLSLFFFFGTLILGAILLRLNLSAHCFWTDESYSLNMASKSLKDLIASVYQQDPHPPLYYILLKLWGMLFSYTIMPGLYFSIIFGFMAALLGCYLYTLIFDTKENIWIPCAVIITSPFFIMFTRMIRYYSYAAFLVVLLLTLLIKFVSHSAKRWWWLLLAGHILLIYSDYPASTIFLGEFIGLLLLRKRFPGKLRQLILIQLIAFLSFLPWLKQLLYHIFHLSSISDHAALSGNYLGIIIRAGFTIYDFLVGQCIYPWQIYITLPLFLLHITAFAVFLTGLKTLPPIVRSKTILVIVAVFISFLSVIILSSKLVGKQSFIYISVRMMFLFVPVMVMISRGYTWFGRYRYIAVVVLIVLNMFVLNSYYNKRYFLNPLYAIDWQTVVYDVNQLMEYGDIIISDEAEVVRYYARQDIPKATFFYDDMDLMEFILSEVSHKKTQRFFMLQTERDSTSPPEFDKEFFDFLMKKGIISVRKDYTQVSPMYYSIKKKLTGAAYGHKLHLFIIKISTEDLKTYFEEILFKNTFL